jgi:glycosyltransferase involved in cell wall biosynthesis
LESRILDAADAVVLVSGTEANELKGALRANLAAKVTIIPPAMPQINPTMPSTVIERFVFVGADSLLQNRRTIEALTDLWSRLRPTTPLHLYGRQKGVYAQKHGIIVHGFVDDIAQAYVPGSVMLAPSFVSGGVKTKVLEAFAYGIAVVGNRTTFEGIDAPTESLILEAGALEDFIRSPHLQAANLAHAAQEVIAQARDRHSTVRLSAQWRSVVWPGQSSV